MSDTITLSPTLILQKTKQKSIFDVKQLNVWNQNLGDVSVLENCTNLEVLSLSVNRIKTLKSFQKLSKLKELYLRNNEIGSLSELKYLRNLSDLHVLWLCGNPCADDSNYRLKVIAALPSVQRLDSHEVTSEERNQARTYESIIDSILESDRIYSGSNAPVSNSRESAQGKRSSWQTKDEDYVQVKRSNWQTEEEANPLNIIKNKIKDDQIYVFDANDNMSYQQLQSTLRQLQEKVDHQDSLIKAQIDKKPSTTTSTQDNILKATLTLVKELSYSQLKTLEKEIEILKLKQKQ